MLVSTKNKLSHVQGIGISTIYNIAMYPPPPPQFNHNLDMLSDAQRIHQMRLLLSRGYADRVVIAQDIHLKHRLVSTST